MGHCDVPLEITRMKTLAVFLVLGLVAVTFAASLDKAESRAKRQSWSRFRMDFHGPPSGPCHGPAEKSSRFSCWARLPRWTYRNGHCVFFVFSGCNRLPNNYISKELCEQKCKRN